MPSQFVHLSIAARSGQALGLAAEHRSLYVLGSIAPDACGLLGWDRTVTHFWPGEGEVSSVFRLLERYPQLAGPRLPAPERTIVAGYLSHLITDEQEVFAIYRPYLRDPRDPHHRYGGRGSPADRERRSHLLVLLEELVEVADPATVRHAVEDLRAATRLTVRDDVLPFLSMAHIKAWADLALAVASVPPGWPRLMRLRALRPAPADQGKTPAPGPVDEGPRALEAELRRVIPPSAVRSFAERSIDESVGFVGAYLAGRPLPTPEGTTRPGGGKQ
jgi:hypothetical protein